MKTTSPAEAFTLLAQLNPVPATAHDDLLARLDEIEPVLPRLEFFPRRSRRKFPLVAVAVFLVVVGVVGVAVASSWGPLSGIRVLDHPVTPTDTVGPAVTTQLRSDERPSDPADAIGTRLIDQARRLGTLPDGTKVYAVPSSKGKFCVVVALRAESCSDALTHAHPITETVMKPGPWTPPVVYGATTNDVVSVSLMVGGQPVTVPVHDNFYAWEGLPEQAMLAVSSATVTFSDGTRQPVQ